MRFRIMNHEGDSKPVFDNADPASMKEAEELFHKLLGDGYRPAFSYGDGESKMPAKSEQVFDPKASEIIFARPMQGG